MMRFLKKWWVLTAISCGTFMATLDSSIVNIALPTLTDELNTNLAQAKWVVIVYYLIITCLLLPFGRLSDQIGRKKIFTLGFLIFTTGSIFCALSVSLLNLIVSRVIQAVGASMLMANGPAIITYSFPAKERGKALGTLAMVVSAGLISGPSIGGLFISELGWRSIFLVNVPFGLAGMYLTFQFITEDSHHVSHIKKAFDWAGAIIQSLIIVIVIFISDPPNISISGSNPIIIPQWLLVCLLTVLIVIFHKIEKQIQYPLFDFSLIRNKTYISGNIASLLIFISYSSIAILMPFFLEEVLYLSTKNAGLYMTLIPISIFIVAPISGRISDKIGSQELCFLGALVSAVVFFIMSGAIGEGLHSEIKGYFLSALLCLTGVALGLFQSPNNNAIMSSVPRNKLGAASALLATIRNLGLVIGTGIATSLYTNELERGGSHTESIHHAYIVAGVFSIAAMLVSLNKQKGPHWKEKE